MWIRLLLGLALCAGCNSTSTDELSDDTDRETDTDTDTAPVDDREFVDVGHTREFRGVWVATVWNINFPSSRSLSVDAQQAELDALVDAVHGANGNAILFQVRPEGDALYASSLEPWSRWLTGVQGQDPGYDPLEYLLQAAHAKNIEVHAWLNPYRAASSRTPTLADNHWAKRFEDYAYPYGSLMWMDPGAPEVREHTIAVCDDLATRYDIDGIHFDDYFYPYPTDEAFPDQPLYDAYIASGGTMSRGDWRRNNVHQLVEGVHDVLEDNAHIRFGIGPFGIYRPGQPPGIVGLDSYEAIYADPLPWLENGWVDYLAPQLYWPSTQTKQAYEPLVKWWGEQAEEAYIFPGNYLAKLGSSSAWTVDEFRTQLALTRAERDAGVQGNVMYHIGPLLKNSANIRDVFAAEFWPTPVLTPPLVRAQTATTDAPWMELTETGVSIRLKNEATPRAWTVYQTDDSGAWALVEIVPGAVSEIALGSGRWAVAAVTKQGVESQGVRVDIP